MAVLYQKYRPQAFSEVFGQNSIKTVLQNEISQDQLAHAYLFCGPRAVGKTTLARIFSKAVNCQKRKVGDSEPCNDCPACNSINNFSNLDVIEIDAASNTGVDNVRDNIISLSRIKSSDNKYKIFIIDEVHMLSTPAFNALLKTLEEPPRNVIFILCTTEVYKLPLTIVSRCERFDFKKISLKDMIAKLELIVKNEKLKIDQEVLELIALKSEGHLRDAESLLNQIIAISDGKIDLKAAHLIIPHSNTDEIISLLESLANNDLAGGIRLINNLVDNGVNLKYFLNDSISLLRKVILNQIDESLDSSLGLDWGESVEKKLNILKKNLSLERLIQISEEFILAAKSINNALIPQMPLELAIINLSQATKKINSTNTEKVFTETKAKEESLGLDEEYSSTKGDNSSEEMIAAIDEDLVKKKWPEFLNKLKPHNHSLSFLMQSCQINGVQSDKICLSFRYKFHQERLNDPQMKEIVESILLEVFGVRLGIKAQINENLKTEKKEDNDDLLNNLLKTFGGKVIN